MAFKDSLAKLQEIDLSDIDLNDLDFSAAGQWPKPVKAITGMVVFAVVLALGYFLIISDMQSTLQKRQAEEQSLRSDFETKYLQSANLLAYRAQAKEMEEKFETILRQLPSDTEIPGLIEDISAVGTSNGLTFSKIDLLPERVLEYYVEKPIQIEVTGSYHDLGAFVSDIADLSRIVTLHDFDIAPSGSQRDGRGLLKMAIRAKTYRYKED